VIRRRRVIYVEGYDPQGAEGYHNLFARSWKRFVKNWGFKSRLGELAIESQDFAHWDVEAAGPNWRVETRYDFLRQEHIIRANMAEPMLRQVPRALAWTFDYLVSGTIVRVLFASWEFGLALIHFQLMVVWSLVLSIGGGWLIGRTAVRRFDLLDPVGLLISVIAAVAIFWAMRPLARQWSVIQISNHWPYLCEFARGEATCFDAPIEACAQRVIAAARANDADEIVVIGHSGGGVLAPAVMTRALELDPEVGRRGPPLVLLTLGSIAPGAALHPKAERLRSVFARLAVEPSITWVDVQSRKDALNFWDFDPIGGLGIKLDGERCNPIVWKVRFREMLSYDFYRRLRLNFFRLHYQFIMATDQRAPYDYFMLVAGPVPVVAWAKDPQGTLARFATDGSLAEDRAQVPAEVTP
jgi:hypothetical protein